MHRKLSLKTEISVIFYPFYPKISDSFFLLCPNSSSERTNGILLKGSVRISNLYKNPKTATYATSTNKSIKSFDSKLGP